ncbi:MAG: hypothetical protein WC076_02060 [Terrimicrobiaceae bacterium]
MKTPFLLFLLCLLLSPVGAAASTPPAGEDYISRLQKAVDVWQDELPALEKCAAAAASKIIAGGNLYLGGAQPSFVEEGIARSGGMTMSHPVSVSTRFTSNDVVLAAWVKARDDPAAAALLEKAAAGGAQVVLFSNTCHPANKAIAVFPSRAAPAPVGEPSVESVSNVVGMWAWTGAFVAACIRQGKMPCMFESMFMPGAIPRDTRFREAPFHAQNLAGREKVPDLGRAYLEIVSGSLRRLKEKNGEAFGRAAKLLREAHENGRPVKVIPLGHMFPTEMQANAIPSWITAAPEKYVPTAECLPLYIGYQWFPWENAALTGAARVPSILTTSRRPTGEWVEDAEHVYIDPCWEVQDAGVELPGYDINILPVSGVMQSAIFWELLERIAK